MNEAYGGCECGGLSCYSCRLRGAQNYSQMVCAHGRPSGIGCDDCVRELGQYMNKQGYYINEKK